MNLFKSAYICECPICDFSTYHDLWFANHVKKNHSSFKVFKKYYGPCQTLVRGNGEFKCGLCDTAVRHIATAVDGHLKKSHGLTWEAFVNKVKSKRAENFVFKRLGSFSFTCGQTSIDTSPQHNS